MLNSKKNPFGGNLDSNPIVPHGMFGNRRKAMSEISLEVRLKYEEQLKEFSFFKRLILKYKIYKEIRAEMKKRFPPFALY